MEHVLLPDVFAWLRAIYGESLATIVSLSLSFKVSGMPHNIAYVGVAISWKKIGASITTYNELIEQN